MPSTPRLRRSLSPSSAGRKHGSPPVSPSGGRGSLERTPRCRGLRPGAHSPVEKMPLRASASALQAKPGSPSGSTKAALEAEVAALRSQLSDQAESHQADMSALHAEQAMRRAALEESVRAEAAEAERVLCLQFADEACAYKVQTSRALEEAQACARAASRREMRALRRQLEGRAGLILLCGPPCGGKSLLAEALSAQLEIPHASLPTLLEEGAAAAGADGEKLRTALQEGAPLPPGVLLRLVLRAASLAQAGLMLLECPAHSALLPSLLLRLPPPLLLLLVDAPDAVCLRRMKHRSRAAGALGPDTAGMPALSPASLPPPSASALLLGSEEEGAPRARHSGEHGVDGAGGAADFPLPGTPTHGRGSGHMVDLLHRYRATDERVARALGQRCAPRNH